MHHSTNNPQTRIKHHSGRLPGKYTTLGYTIFYLSLIVLLPLTAAFWKSAELGISGFWECITRPRVLHALQLSFTTSFFAAVVNTCIGTLFAWVLVRYQFPGNKLMDALMDLPFALPTAVAGIALTTLYAPNGLLGRVLHEWFGIKVAFTPLGITLALVFVGIPFVVRTVQPIIQTLDLEQEEAAHLLGASRPQTVRRVILPALVPSIVTGFTLAFARGIGEYGSVVFISGNMPMRTEIAPLLIVTQLEQYDYAAANAIAVAMLMLSFISLLLINLLQLWNSKRMGIAS